MTTYAGIGSRETPPDVLVQIEELAGDLAQCGIILRSGGAPGADTSFEWGCTVMGGTSEIYLPWKNFQKNKSHLYPPTDMAYEIASKYHPRWFGLSVAAKKLMARNTHQILGQDCKTPSDFVICWTPDGATGETTTKTGGTGQAIRIAADLGIPVFNLKNEGTLDEILNFVRSL